MVKRDGVEDGFEDDFCMVWLQIYPLGVSRGILAARLLIQQCMIRHDPRYRLGRYI